MLWEVRKVDDWKCSLKKSAQPSNAFLPQLLIGHNHPLEKSKIELNHLSNAISITRLSAEEFVQFKMDYDAQYFSTWGRIHMEMSKFEFCSRFLDSGYLQVFSSLKIGFKNGSHSSQEQRTNNSFSWCWKFLTSTRCFNTRQHTPKQGSFDVSKISTETLNVGCNYSKKIEESIKLKSTNQISYQLLFSSFINPSYILSLLSFRIIVFSCEKHKFAHFMKVLQLVCPSSAIFIGRDVGRRWINFYSLQFVRNVLPVSINRKFSTVNCQPVGINRKVSTVNCQPVNYLCHETERGRLK